MCSYLNNIETRKANTTGKKRREGNGGLWISKPSYTWQWNKASPNSNISFTLESKLETKICSCDTQKRKSEFVLILSRLISKVYGQHSIVNTGLQILIDENLKKSCFAYLVLFGEYM